MSLTISLAKTTTILLLVILIITLLAILGVVALLVVLLLLVLWHEASSKALARLEGLSGRLERGYIGAEATLRLAGVLVDVELLLGLAREIVVLSSRIILPRVEVRHVG